VTKFVIPGLVVPGIHVLQPRSRKDVDGRDRPGHEEKTSSIPRLTIRDGLLTAWLRVLKCLFLRHLRAFAASALIIA
jgi:hypothetical protein